MVGSLAELFAGLVSPELATVAVLVTAGAAAALTPKVRVTGMLAPGGGELGFVQLTVWAADEMPVPPVAATGVGGGLRS